MRPKNDAVTFAADELSRYLSAILLEAPLGREAKATITLESDSSLPEEGYAWVIDPRGVQIAASDAAGLVFGVYAFLQEVCGCRFSAPGPDGEYVPRLRELCLRFGSVRRSPLLPYRAIQVAYLEPLDLLRHQIDWAAKNGLNYVTYLLASSGQEGRIDVDPQTGEPVAHANGKAVYLTREIFEKHLLPEIRKRGLKLDFSHHNLLFWLPPATYLQEHPEWYALRDGVRGGDLSQLAVCTSNPEAVKEIICNARSYACQHPELRILGVVPEDGVGMCECAACAREDDRPAAQSSPWRGHLRAEAENLNKSRRYARLLNQVAEALAEEFPALQIGAAAYVDLQWPPQGIELHRNVVVWLAVYWRDGARPLTEADSSPNNQCFSALIRDWRDRIGERLGLYEYYMGMNAQRSLPYPISRVICREWRSLRAIGLRGATVQCLATVHAAYALNMLAFARCGWTDRVDHERVLDDYLDGAFGRAGRDLRPIFAAMLDATDRIERQVAGSEPSPRGISGWVLQPNGENAGYFLGAIAPGEMERCLSAARASARERREREQVERFAHYLAYCRAAAKLSEALTNSGSSIAGEVDQALSRVLSLISDRRSVGWISPTHAARWERSARGCGRP